MKLFPRLIYRLWSGAIDKNLFCLIESVLFLFWNECKCRACIIFIQFLNDGDVKRDICR